MAKTSPDEENAFAVPSPSQCEGTIAGGEAQASRTATSANGGAHAIAAATATP